MVEWLYSVLFFVASFQALFELKQKGNEGYTFGIILSGVAGFSFFKMLGG